MAAKPTIAIIGPGRLGGAMDLALRISGYRIPVIGSKDSPGSVRRARKVADVAGALVVSHGSRLDADVVWFCVPDREIRNAAREWMDSTEWRKKIAFHASGALSSDELDPLRR